MPEPATAEAPTEASTPPAESAPSSEQPSPSSEPTSTPTPSESPSESPSEKGQQSPTALTEEPTELPQAAPASWPENWRELIAGDNKKDLAALKRLADPSLLYKQSQELRKKLSQGVHKDPKPKTEDAKALTEWRLSADIPESPSGYYDSLPEGVKIDDSQKATVDRYFQFTHENDISREEAYKGLNYMFQEEAAALEQMVENDRANYQKSDDVLRQMYGSDYRPNMNKLHSMLDFYGDEGLVEAVNEARLPDGTLLWHHTPFVKMMVGLAGEAMEDTINMPGDVESKLEKVTDEIKKIEEEMKDTKGDYHRNPDKQKRLRDLYEAEDRLKARR